MKSRYTVLRENKNYAVYDLSKVNNLPILEQVAGGAVVDACALKKEFPETLKKVELIPHLYYLLHSKYPRVIITKNDPITHYSSDSLGKYLKKIIWRVKNNIFFKDDMGGSGFTGREKYAQTPSYRKYLFLPYALTMVLPLLDAIYLCLTRKDLKYFIHVFLVLFTAIVIVYSYLKKLYGSKVALKSYDDTKVINAKLR